MHRAVSRRSLIPILLPIAIGLTAGSTSGIALGSDAQPAAPGAAATESPAGTGSVALEGVDWILRTYRSGDTLVELEDRAGPARLRFEGGRVSGSAGCNRLMGAYTLAGSAIHFEPSMAATMMACPEPLMAQEQAVHVALGSVASHRLDAGRLELLDVDGGLLLGFAALEPLSLAGPVWQLLAYNNGKQAVVSALAGTQLTLELREDGTLGGYDGCNRYMSGYTLAGDTLTIGPIATTRMACRGPAGAAEQAAAYAAALGTVTGFRIEGEALTLLTGEGATAVRYRAEPASPSTAPGDPSP